MTYLQFLLAEAMGMQANDPRVIAAVKAIQGAKIIDPWRLVKLQIQADPCRDYRAVMRKYHVSRSFVFNVWGIVEPRGLSAASPQRFQVKA